MHSATPGIRDLASRCELRNPGRAQSGRGPGSRNRGSKRIFAGKVTQFAIEHRAFASAARKFASAAQGVAHSKASRCGNSSRIRQTGSRCRQTGAWRRGFREVRPDRGTLNREDSGCRRQMDFCRPAVIPSIPGLLHRCTCPCHRPRPVGTTAHSPGIYPWDSEEHPSPPRVETLGYPLLSLRDKKGDSAPTWRGVAKITNRPRAPPPTTPPPEPAADIRSPPPAPAPAPHESAPRRDPPGPGRGAPIRGARRTRAGASARARRSPRPR